MNAEEALRVLTPVDGGPSVSLEDALHVAESHPRERVVQIRFLQMVISYTLQGSLPVGVLHRLAAISSEFGDCQEILPAVHDAYFHFVDAWDFDRPLPESGLMKTLTLGLLKHRDPIEGLKACHLIDENTSSALLATLVEDGAVRLLIEYGRANTDHWLRQHAALRALFSLSSSTSRTHTRTLLSDGLVGYAIDEARAHPEEAVCVVCMLVPVIRAAAPWAHFSSSGVLEGLLAIARQAADRHAAGDDAGVVAMSGCMLAVSFIVGIESDEWRPSMACHSGWPQSFRDRVTAVLALSLESPTTGRARHPQSHLHRLPPELLCLILAGAASDFDNAVPLLLSHDALAVATSVLNIAQFTDKDILRNGHRAAASVLFAIAESPGVADLLLDTAAIPLLVHLMHTETAELVTADVTVDLLSELIDHCGSEAKRTAIAQRIASLRDESDPAVSFRDILAGAVKRFGDDADFVDDCADLVQEVCGHAELR